jgi:hypothetical protein
MEGGRGDKLIQNFMEYISGKAAMWKNEEMGDIALMMDAVRTSETSLTSTRLHDGIS